MSFFFFLKSILISPVHSVPTPLSIALCIPLRGGLPEVLRLTQMFPSVCVCSPKWLHRETLSCRPTGPRVATSTISPRSVSILSHTPDNLIPRFPPKHPVAEVLIISTGLLVLIS